MRNRKIFCKSGPGEKQTYLAPLLASKTVQSTCTIIPAVPNSGLNNMGTLEVI